LRKSWGAGLLTPVAVYVGRIAGEKNVPLAIEAVCAMRKLLPDLKFVIVGDGPERARIEKEHPEFIFAGMRRGEDLAAHYASADCFVFASTTETFGNVVTEAMASGLPVLAYNYAAPARYVAEGVSGLLADYGNAKAFLEKARTMAATQGRWRSMGIASATTARGMSWDAVIDTYLRDVAEVIATKS
jgi:glycosyltransferase involved in cell wall biosynthesis